MKTSNKLLIALLAITLLFGLSANSILKIEFDKINKGDQYVGYRKEPLKPFKYVTLGGKDFGYAQIEPGKNFEIRTTANPKILNWKIENDTLKLNYDKDWNDEGYGAINPFWGTPVIYVLAPELSGIESRGVICKVNGWTSKNLTINQQGQRMLITNSTIDTLSARIDLDGYLEIDKKNNIALANVNVKNNSNFITENVYRTFNMHADSAAHVSLPGNLLRKVKLSE
jgi:hypothetical protein